MKFKGIQTVEASQQLITPLGEAAVVNGTAPIIETRSHVVSYESTDPIIDDSYKMSDLPGELVSSRTITSGNRTFETITVTESFIFNCVMILVQHIFENNVSRYAFHDHLLFLFVQLSF